MDEALVTQNRVVNGRQGGVFLVRSKDGEFDGGPWLLTQTGTYNGTGRGMTIKHITRVPRYCKISQGSKVPRL